MAMFKVSAAVSSEKSDGECSKLVKKLPCSEYSCKGACKTVVVLGSMALFRAEQSSCNQTLSIMLYFWGGLILLIFLVASEVYIRRSLFFSFSVFCNNVNLLSALCTQSV